MTRKIIFLISVLVYCGLAKAQDSIYTDEISIDGTIYTAVISECDTILLSYIDDINITAPRSFSDYEEYKKYVRYRRYANKVFPYAVRAIKTYRELEEDTKDMTRRKKKKYSKKLQERLEKELKQPLKKLTRTEGFILVKMIENELDAPMYKVVKSLRGGATAFYWNSFGKLYGYNLKEGYIKGKDKILDIVLYDFDISYQVIE